MCGIVGYTQVGRKLPTSLLDAGLAVLRHRGPDHAGCYRTPHVALGATRLRIIDILNGDQPMLSHDGQTAVAFNGEIYNHAVLRQELEALGARFRSRCDTEVILQAWLHWGPASFARLRGMFAIALWEEREQRLVLARDRHGIKPLYYTRVGRDLSFGSELKCLFADPQTPRTIDLAGLNCFLSLNYVPAPYTLACGITKLLPGCLLEWRKGKVTVSSYAPPAERKPAPATLAAASEELDALLTAAVREQLAADVPLGLWLSGGVDSSTILHYASALTAQPLKTYSVTFHGKSFDESRWIQDVTRQYGTDHTEFDLSPQPDLVDVIGELAYYSDEPSADAGAISVWYLARMTRREVTTVLSGEGADELFGGYLTYKADHFRQALEPVPDLFKRAALRCARILPASNEKIGLDYKLLRFLSGTRMGPEAAHVYWNGAFSEEEKQRIFRFADGAPMRVLLGSMRPGRTLERFLDFDRRYSLPDGILYKVDRMSMAHAVEVRPPFLDDRIMEFAARLPHHFKIAHGETKRVLRRLMHNRLPESVLRRPKIGFDIPVHEWFRGPLKALLLDTLSASALAQNRLFYAPAVEALIRQHLERRANWGYHLWGLMTLQIWMRRWKIEVPETAPVERVSHSQTFVPGLLPDWQTAPYTARVAVEAPEA